MARGPGDLVAKLFRRDGLNGTTATGLPQETAGVQNPVVDDKTAADGAVEPSPHSDSEEHVQRGIKQAEAVTAVWTKKALIIAYAGYVDAFYAPSCSVIRKETAPVGASG